MIITVMGLIALVMMAAMGSFFVGKVGGAENVSVLRGELTELYAFCLDPGREFTVHVKMRDGRAGILVSFEPGESLADDREKLERQLRKIAGYIFGQPSWESRVEFVTFKLTGARGLGREATIDRPRRIVAVEKNG